MVCCRLARGGEPCRHPLRRQFDVGVLGFFDVATKLGVTEQKEDFGQTLGWWGVPAGPYLVLPDTRPIGRS